MILSIYEVAQLLNIYFLRFKSLSIYVKPSLKYLGPKINGTGWFILSVYSDIKSMMKWHNFLPSSFSYKLYVPKNKDKTILEKTLDVSFRDEISIIYWMPNLRFFEFYFIIHSNPDKIYIFQQSHELFYWEINNWIKN